MGNWNTVSFARWWLTKLGVVHSNYTSPAMRAGTAYEHPILAELGIRKTDRQIKMRKYRLRVNLDGEDNETVFEVKTHSKDFRVTKAYWRQCQVEMFATGKRCTVIAYRLTEDDYLNFFNSIDKDRIQFFPVKYDAQWIENEYLPRLKYLCECLKKRRTPDASRI